MLTIALALTFAIIIILSLTIAVELSESRLLGAPREASPNIRLPK
jgi:hypothetical protein